MRVEVGSRSGVGFTSIVLIISGVRGNFRVKIGFEI